MKEKNVTNPQTTDMYKIFDFFKFRELFPNCSSSEIAECIDTGYIDGLVHLVFILDAFRDGYPDPIRITSGYRNKIHNKQVGGSETSQHLVGDAVDFTSKDFESLATVFLNWLRLTHYETVIGQVIVNHKKKYIHMAAISSKYKSLTISHIN